MLGADQYAACRYVRIADCILATMLPTPHRFIDVLRHVHSPERPAALFYPEGVAADTILPDGARVRFVFCCKNGPSIGKLASANPWARHCLPADPELPHLHNHDCVMPLAHLATE